MRTCALLCLVLGLWAASAQAESRIALVIGNAAYTGVGQLTNPVNDARDMAAMLRGQGFSVTLRENATKRVMDEALRGFGDLVSTYPGVALFYFSGHGSQFQGENFLIPVDATLSRSDEIR